MSTATSPSTKPPLLLAPSGRGLLRAAEILRPAVEVFENYISSRSLIRVLTILLMYTGLLGVVFWLSNQLRWDFDMPAKYELQYLTLLLPIVACKLLMLYSFGQFRSILSYFGPADFGAVTLAMAIISGVMFALYYGADPMAAPPRSVIVMDFVLSVAAVSAFRFSWRSTRAWILTERSPTGSTERRVVIVGAGDRGAELAQDLLARRGAGITPVFFVDNDANKIGLSIHGLPVFGPLDRLRQLGPVARINEIVVAFSKEDSGQLYQIVEIGRQLGASTRIIPSFRELATGEVKFEQARPTWDRLAPLARSPAAAAPTTPLVLPELRPVKSKVFLSPPHLGAAEFAYIEEAFRTNWIAPVGPNVDAFEKEFCAQFGFGHAAALSSGTAALHLAIRMLGVKPGDEVVCSSLTFAASANPIIYQGAFPVLIDSSEETWNMDPHLLEEWLERRAMQGRLPRAVIGVDLYGQCAGMEKVEEICARYGVPLVEDAAEALGATTAGRPAGSFGRLGIFSFNGNKIITTSGGGMLVSNEEKFIAQARFLATQARDPAPHYQHSQIGYNYRLSNVLAGIGRGQLQVLESRVNARRRIFGRYAEALGDLSGLKFMPETPGSRSNRWLSCLTIDPAAAGVTTEQVRRALELDEIEARPVWKPLHLQPVFAGYETVGGAVSERLFTQGLCLPSGSSMADTEQERVIDIIRGVFARR